MTNNLDTLEIEFLSGKEATINGEKFTGKDITDLLAKVSTELVLTYKLPIMAVLAFADEVMTDYAKKEALEEAMNMFFGNKFSTAH